MTSRSAAKSSFFLEILASQKLDRGRVVAKSKWLVAVAEEEIKRWGNTAFSLSLPSFLLLQQITVALPGAARQLWARTPTSWCTSGPARSWGRSGPGGKLPWRIFPLVYIQNALN